MVIFEDIEDVVEWLGPISYIDLWDVLAPHGIFDEDTRSHCDTQIAKGVVSQDTVLKCLKTEARMILTDRYGLVTRVHEPTQRQYLRSTH